MARKNEEYKQYAKYGIMAIIGAIVLALVAYMAFYDGQPKKYFCEGAAINCPNCGGSSGDGDGADSTPYGSCDSCCPSVGINTCAGAVPSEYSYDWDMAEGYCGAKDSLCPNREYCYANMTSGGFVLSGVESSDDKASLSSAGMIAWGGETYECVCGNYPD